MSHQKKANSWSPGQERDMTAFSRCAHFDLSPEAELRQSPTYFAWEKQGLYQPPPPKSYADIAIDNVKASKPVSGHIYRALSSLFSTIRSIVSTRSSHKMADPKSSPCPSQHEQDHLLQSEVKHAAAEPARSLEGAMRRGSWAGHVPNGYQDLRLQELHRREVCIGFQYRTPPKGLEDPWKFKSAGWSTFKRERAYASLFIALGLEGIRTKHDGCQKYKPLSHGI